MNKEINKSPHVGCQLRVAQKSAVCQAKATAIMFISYFTEIEIYQRRCREVEIVIGNGAFRVIE